MASNMNCDNWPSDTVHSSSSGIFWGSRELFLSTGLLVRRQYVCGRSCDRPFRHRIFWFSLVLRRTLRWFWRCMLVLHMQRFQFQSIGIEPICCRNHHSNFPNHTIYNELRKQNFPPTIMSSAVSTETTEIILWEYYDFDNKRKVRV